LEPVARYRSRCGRPSSTFADCHGAGVTSARPHLCLRDQPSRAIQIYCDSQNSSEPEIAARPRRGHSRAAEREGRQPGSPGRRGRDHQEHALPDRAGRRQPVLGDRGGNRQGAGGLRGRVGEARRPSRVRAAPQRGCDQNVTTTARNAPESAGRAGNPKSADDRRFGSASAKPGASRNSEVCARQDSNL
jgi:hypothetical protein